MSFFNKNKGSKGLGEKGLATVYFVLFLVFFIGPLFALAIDFAYVYFVRGQLQNAADAAALAGAAKIVSLNDSVQTDARAEAAAFAAKNFATRDPVYLRSDGSNTLSDDNDITVGFWNVDNSTYSPGVGPYNAVHVIARRTSTDGGANVRSFFSLLLTRFIEGGGVSINISDATAYRQIGPTTAMSFCTKFCDQVGSFANSSTVPIPITFPNAAFPNTSGLSLFFKEKQLPEYPADENAPIYIQIPYSSVVVGDPINWRGAAWTEYDPSSATNFGPDSYIAKLIRGEEKVPNKCTTFTSYDPPVATYPDTEMYTTNNAAGGQIMGVLLDTFEEKAFLNSTSGEYEWTVTAPIFGPDASGNPSCPPGAQPEEPYTVDAYAKVKIVKVTGNPSPRLYIRSIKCIHCANAALDQEIISDKTSLVE